MTAGRTLEIDAEHFFTPPLASGLQTLYLDSTCFPEAGGKSHLLLLNSGNDQLRISGMYIEYLSERPTNVQIDTCAPEVGEGGSAGEENAAGGDEANDGGSAGEENAMGGDEAADGSFCGEDNTMGGDEAADGGSAGEENTMGGDEVAGGGSAGEENFMGGDEAADGGTAGEDNTTGGGEAGDSDGYGQHALRSSARHS